MDDCQLTDRLSLDSGAVRPDNRSNIKDSPQLRDIRQDLKDRIAQKRRYKANCLTNAEEAERDAVALEKMLFEEEERLSNEEARLAFSARSITMTIVPPAVPLDQFLRKELRFEPHTKEELRQKAEQAGYFNAGKESPGRVIHAKLMNLGRYGESVVTPDGKITLTPKGREALKKNEAH